MKKNRPAKKISESATFRILFSDDIIPRYIPLSYRIYLLLAKLKSSLSKRIFGKREPKLQKTYIQLTRRTVYGRTTMPFINKTFITRNEDLETPVVKRYAQDLLSLRASLRSKGLKITSMGGSFKEKDFNPDNERIKLWENSWILTHATPRASDTVLDLGGASSLFSFYLALMGCKIHVLDYDVSNNGIIYNARHVAREMGWKNMILHRRDLTRKLPFRSGMFDRVYCICVLEHLPSKVRIKVMQEIERVLKPGGVAALTVDFDSGRDDPFSDQGLRYGDRPRFESDILGASGLKIFGNELLLDDCPEEFFLGSLFLKKSQVC